MRSLENSSGGWCSMKHGTTAAVMSGSLPEEDFKKFYSFFFVTPSVKKKKKKRFSLPLFLSNEICL